MRSNENSNALFEDNQKEPLIVVAGPTAVGKSDLALFLAKHLHGAVLSADSMQVYRGMDIGTAKVREEERRGIPHYLIDILSPEEEWNVMRFLTEAKKAYGMIRKQGQLPILCGGTGFYVDAFVRDVDFTEEETDPLYRESLYQEAAGDVLSLYRKLQQTDPDYAKEIHPNNVKRIVRALEYHHLTGQTLSFHNRTQKEKASPYKVFYLVLTDERKTLYERIDRRVDAMMEEGLLAEVISLKEQYPSLTDVSRLSVSMQGIGYKELLLYLDGQLSLQEAVDLIKQNTRHFAKRQLTWFKKSPGAVFFSLEKERDRDRFYESILEKIKEYYQ